ncbi:bifunctional diaminohydroxyphosphoribosylaminopyrimidine deaminase/5-amino-6-(5-phosphoribosylamino)uracil reductase RibD [Sneathiella sp. P13V-1]|nr:bifunctional diaminohydroxyphosphoribosylaminopyrimidine deaminase/5-amino-6-(5-phosphoribosylamino)uracil reductase RibD [Sneathiella sp. P13V-1]
MKMALQLARRGLGQVAPNPAVGCLIVKDNLVVGRGHTQVGGRPHAEVVALSEAGDHAKGATAYVTLEPCSHHGKTPPCAEALINAGVARVVVAMGDPDERVDGDGVEMLRDAGVEVTVGVLQKQALENNLGFVLNRTISRPKVMLKTATTLDGKIATHTGNSQWITGPDARRFGHMLRAKNDAIMVGIGTVLADDPRLDCRIPGLENRSPIRIVADTRLRLPLTSELVKTANEIPVWVLTLKGNAPERIDALEDLGVKVIELCAGESGYPDMSEALNVLSEAGITRLLVEGGSHLQASLVKEDLVDELYWFRASKLVGGDGISVLQSLGLDLIADAVSMKLADHRQLGDDRLEIYNFRTE